MVLDLLGHELPECRDCPHLPLNLELALVCLQGLYAVVPGQLMPHLLALPCLAQGSHPHKVCPVGLHGLPPWPHQSQTV